jgi:hypothetical protein
VGTLSLAHPLRINKTRECPFAPRGIVGRVRHRRPSRFFAAHHIGVATGPTKQPNTAVRRHVTLPDVRRHVTLPEVG